MSGVLASQAAYCIRQSLINNEESGGLYVIDQAVKTCPDEDTANLLDRISKAFVQHWYYSYVVYRRVCDDRMWCTKIAACLMIAYLNHKRADINYIIKQASNVARDRENDVDTFCILDSVVY